jgi:peptidoglycan/LPS O-acetylase OafA/YrhL
MKRRNDIDGLRSIAISAVVLYHAWRYRLQGGFVGVDIFFVISGFLITNNINVQLESSIFKLKDFFYGRIKRLMPVLCFVLVIALLVASFLLHGYEFYELCRQALAGLTFSSNFYFYNTAGYFSTKTDLQPLIHFWSLAVEEQFYIIWPVLLLLITKKKLNKYWITLIIIFSSFFWSVIQSGSNGSYAFYMLPTRFWELLLGGFLALIPGHCLFNIKNNKISLLVNNISSLLGLLMIFLSFIFIDKGNFSGYAASLPTIGTLLVISAGESSFLNRTFLSLTPMIYVGLVSYSFYLWHWVFLSYLNMIWGAPNYMLKLSVIGISFIFSMFTYHFIENPLSKVSVKKDKEKVKKIVLITLSLCMALIAFTSVHLLKNKKDEYFFQSEEVNGWVNSGWWDQSGITEFGCHKSRYETKVELMNCLHSNGLKKLVVIGDSHGGNWSPMVKKVAKKIGFGFDTLTIGSGCSFRPDSMISDKLDGKTKCKLYNDFLMNELIEKINQGDIIIIGTHSSFITEKNYQEYKKHLTLISEAIKTKNAHLVLMNDGPHIDVIPIQCIRRSYMDRIPPSCIIPKGTTLRARKFLTKAINIEKENTYIFDPLDLICADQCVHFNKLNQVVIVDGAHLSVGASESFAEEFIKFLELNKIK